MEVSRWSEGELGTGYNDLLGMSSTTQRLFEDRPKRAGPARSGYPSTILACWILAPRPPDPADGRVCAHV